MLIKKRISTFLKGSNSIISNYGLLVFAKFIIDFSRIKRKLNENISAIIDKYKVEKPGISDKKYLDVNLWVFENLRRVYALGLHKNEVIKTILDIGTGTGYFPFICAYYGHDVEALDVSDNEMYNEIIHALGIKRHEIRICAFKSLELKEKYDLITAFMICFNNHKKPGLWHVAEWEYFIKNIYENNLNSGGSIFLSFNAETVEEPVRKELMAYFSRNNAVTSPATVLIKSNYKYH